jgi:hypothetical protein
MLDFQHYFTLMRAFPIYMSLLDMFNVQIIFLASAHGVLGYAHHTSHPLLAKRGIDQQPILFASL